MSLQLICGGAGSGKTGWCLGQMSASSKNGKKVILIIPEQLSLSAENQAIEALGYLGNGKEVLSFGRLFHRVYNLCDGRQRRYADKIGKTMLMHRIITEESDALLLYGNNSKAPSLSGELLSTISEFKRHNVSPDELSSIPEVLSGGASGHKFHDIAHLYHKYNERINSLGFDSDDNLTLLCDLIPHCEFLQNADIYIDSFSGFTAQEISVIAQLIKHCPSVYVTLCTDLSPQPLFEPTNRTREKLIKASEGNLKPDIKLNENIRHRAEDLRFLEKHYGRYPIVQYDDEPQSIHIKYNDTPYSETDAVARKILALVRDEGYRFADIGVISGDMKAYSPIIEKSFALHHIPCFLDKKHGIMTHPVCLLLLSLCDIFITNFSYESVFSFLKTDLTGIPMESIDLLENYVLETGIKGSTWQNEWEYHLADDKKEEINRSRQSLLDLIMPFREYTKGRSKAEVFAKGIKNFMASVNLPDTIETITKALTNEGNMALALEYRQIFNLVISVMDQMVLCMSDISFGIEKFRDLLTAGLSQCEIGVIPPTGNTVVCGSFDRSKHHALKVLFVLGANEGTFPPAVSGTGMITDAERRALEKNEIHIAPDNRRKAMEQPYLIYELLCTPSEKLFLSYTLANQKGESLSPSSVLTTLKSMFPKIIYTDGLSPSFEELISCPDATLAQLAVHQDISQSVMAWYNSKPQWESKVRLIQKGRSFSLTAGIKKEIAAMVWGSQLNTTITRLEAYAKCPFSFFMQYGLKLKERKKYSFSAPDAGNFIHKIMEDFANYVTQNNLSWDTLDKDFCIKKVSELSDKLIEESIEKMPLISGRHRFLISRLRQSASTAMWAVIRHINAGVFKPYAVEYSIGNPDALPPFEFETPEGNRLSLYGKIDRIDTGEGLFRIIDYKSSTHDIDLSKVYQGVSLQLFVYSTALRNKLGDVGGMFYLTVGTPLIDYHSEMTAEEIENKVLNSLSLNGYMVGDESIVRKMDAQIEGYSGIVSARSTKSGITTTRLLSPKQYTELSREVMSHVAKYGDEILGGNCAVSPLAEGQTSACTYCNFRSTCGFEPHKNSYRRLKKYNNKDILQILSEKAGEDFE